MPSVADAERRTKATQEQRGRKEDRENLLRLVSEGRLHEADGHQLEQIKLALELSELLGTTKQEPTPIIDAETLTAALRGAVADVMAGMPTVSNVGVPTGSHAPDPARPKMKHTSLASITHKDSELSVNHGDTLVQENKGNEDTAEKLRRLKKLKGSK